MFQGTKRATKKKVAFCEQLLSNVFQWVMNTLTRDYSVQFASTPPCFQGMVVTEVCQKVIF